MRMFASILFFLTARLPAAEDHGGLRGEYGFISCAVLGSQPETEARQRVATMARDYGIREFMFYDWFASYSAPTRGSKWKDAFLGKHEIDIATLRITIDEIHHQDGRAWAYVQMLAAEETNLEFPKKDIWKLRNAKGDWYKHPPGDHPRFPTYFPNAAWARHMVAVWAPDVRKLRFDGIHWDTLGKIAGDRDAETRGIHAFLATSHGQLAKYGLLQTVNFVDLNGWDRDIVRRYCAFPYAEVWSPETERRYYAEMDALKLRGAMAMYPTVHKPAGWTDTRVILARHNEARKHHLVYIVLGDGERRLKTEYWPDTAPLNDEEQNELRPQP